MSCRLSPKPERYEVVRSIQAQHILEHLERAGYLIVKADKDRGQKPSNIGACVGQMGRPSPMGPSFYASGRPLLPGYLFGWDPIFLYTRGD